jgi:hypothetical protein
MNLGYMLVDSVSFSVNGITIDSYYIDKFGGYNNGLTFACRHNNKKIIEYMIEHGAKRCQYCYRTPEEHLSEGKSKTDQ